MALQRCLSILPWVIASAGAVLVRKPALCEAELVSYALMTQRVCEFNWALDPSLKLTDPGVKAVSWADTEKVGGCWDLKRYNTDRYMTSAVYQHARSRQCVLAISGYHGGQNGFMNTLLAATQPRENYVLCENQLHAPVVNQFWEHTALSNWSSIAQFLGGARSTCRDVVVTGESMGGSVAELLVGCGTLGEMDKLQPKGLPAFKIKAIYTFGAFAASTTPVRDASSKGGCIKGKRVFHSADMFAQWAKGIGMQHSYMDAVRLYERNGEYTFDALPCSDPGTVTSDKDVPSPFGSSGRPGDMFKIARRMKKENDKDVNTLAAHAIPHYVKQVRALTGNGTLRLNARTGGVDYVGLLKASRLDSALGAGEATSVDI